MQGWKIETSMCTFIVRPYRGRYALFVGGECLQIADKPIDLLSNVESLTSEYPPWDNDMKHYLENLDMTPF